MSTTHRTDLIAGLHALADFLDTNPALPVPTLSADLLVHVRGTDAEQRTEVDRVAGLLGVSVNEQTAHGGHYTAARSFGPVEYRCVAIPAKVMALHEARRTYAHSIIPNGEAA